MKRVPELLYEDQDLVAVFKPVGWLSESVGEEESLESWFQSRGYPKGAVCHRLDRDTSGVILLRKDRRWARELGQLFERKRIRKEYWAIVLGVWPKGLNRVESLIAPDGKGCWRNDEVEGKPAVTTFRVLGETDGKTWIQVLPKTGRTHQIRLHCARVGCPVLGDTVYGEEASDGWMALHARSLAFRHPRDGERIRIEAEPPEEWRPWLERFNRARA